MPFTLGPWVGAPRPVAAQAGPGRVAEAADDDEDDEDDDEGGYTRPTRGDDDDDDEEDDEDDEGGEDDEDDDGETWQVDRSRADRASLQGCLTSVEHPA